ncbi:hypothetical protein [Niameybacter sp.]|uniref:hypothetical protein n=1 Tax=Niameybacter sp. TaxID=2033640 RepID=UPI002FC9BDE2
MMVAIRYRPQSLRNVMPKELWQETNEYQIAEFDTFDTHHFTTDKIDLNMEELFPNVKVQGPFKEKDTAIGYTWIDLRPRINETKETGTYKNLRINIIREEINKKHVHSLNIGNQCYKVISGKDEIDTFIEQMYLLVEKNN